MSNDDESRRGARLGQTVPGYSALAEAFGAAIDGASRMTRNRAKQLAERLLNQAGLDNVDLGEAASEAGARINQLAEEIIAARKANQALLQRTITAELEKSLTRLGLARADEVSALRDEVAQLRNDLAVVKSAAQTAAPAARTEAKKTAATATKKAAAKKTTAPKTAAKKATTKTAAKNTTAGAPTRKSAGAQKAARKTTGAGS
ncbi:polyhydroxyalkanoate synthesis protein PhaF [Microlunatus sp. Gsoil 973]|uniref:polyhydroxyalkanoate synthesis protein PhaF n=1 Tax=Microlunatus sp. Gsoil 973 TaxID=2672569 RepID=UPI0012B4544D|nr:polyhydroxyalkanoate synthesis protein PhaF [Microlunatus sp. Gsoil 973]QGN33161.1 polyhydroxyalkanoate synthesis protein PhaF [Microlunatus sp. Gsoil 973]